MPDKIQKLMAEADEISAEPTSPLSALLYASLQIYLHVCLTLRLSFGHCHAHAGAQLSRLFSATCCSS